MSKLHATAYVDGSAKYSDATMRSAGIMLVSGKTNPLLFAYGKQRPGLKRYAANVAELNAAKTAIKTAKSCGVTRLTICYDWEGIEYFADINHIKARHKKCPAFSQYATFIQSTRKNMCIRFIKVKAHSGDVLNECVDKMTRAGTEQIPLGGFLPAPFKPPAPHTRQSAHCQASNSFV